MPHRLTLTALILTSVALPAAAQDRPPIVPSRDVAVTYRTSGDGQPPGELRMSWLPARNLMRMDMPGGQGWIVVDMGAGSAFMVTDAQRMVMDMPAGAGASRRVTPSATARFTREGAARIANLDCTNWRMEDQGQTSRVCMTADGVMLKTESLTGGPGPARGGLEATAVAYGAQDPARFQRPAGYQGMQLPNIMPPGGLPNMPRGTAIPPPGMGNPGR